jgi:hypothetical protein
MVAGQRRRVGRPHAGTIATVAVEDHTSVSSTASNNCHCTAVPTSTKPIRNFNAQRLLTVAEDEDDAVAVGAVAAAMRKAPAAVADGAFLGVVTASWAR